MTREEFLKDKIQKSGYNTKEFAAYINMPYSTLLSIINKSVGGASLDNIIKICNGLNIDINILNPYANNKAFNNVNYNKLNETGKAKADEYINDLADNPKYISNTMAEEISKDIVEEIVEAISEVKSNV